MHDEENLFQIVFSGTTTGEFDIETSRMRLQNLFQLPESRMNQLFSGKDFVIKANIAEQVAMNFAIKIVEAGCECSIEPIQDKNDLTNNRDFIDRRTGGDQRKYLRRAPRLGATVLDRRLTMRRKADAHQQTQKIG